MEKTQQIKGSEIKAGITVRRYISTEEGYVWVHVARVTILKSDNVIVDGVYDAKDPTSADRLRTTLVTYVTRKNAAAIQLL